MGKLIRRGIRAREQVFIQNKNILNTKLSEEEIDIWTPTTPGRMSGYAFINWCVRDCEANNSKLKFHSHWGRACS